jgi:hypothetical protein
MNKLPLILFALILTASAFAAGDVYVKTKTHSDAVSVGAQSQPAKDSFTETWIGEGKMASISPTNITIVDMKRKVLDFISPKTKTYVETSLPFDIASLLPMQMIGLDKDSLQELNKIKGFQLASEITGDINGAKMHQTTQAIQIIKKSAPAGTYNVPAGYTKKDKLSLQDLPTGN